jgi:hypothetical protein
MSKVKKILGLALNVIVALSITTIPNVTFAKSNNSFYTNEFKSKGDLIQYLNENQVSKDDQKVLIEKLEKNQIWDVNNPEKRKDVPEDFYIFNPQMGSGDRYYRFNDGSFIKISVTQNHAIKIDGSEESKKALREHIKDENLLNKMESDVVQKNSTNGSGISPQGVEYGSGYAWYYDFKVEMTVGTQYASMITEFCLVQGGDDYLIPSGFMQPYVSGFGELGQMPTIQITRANEDSTNSRWALANSNWYCNYPISTPWGGSTLSGTKYLWIGVGSDSYRVSDRLPY